jgi:hypothetical protein
MKSLATTLAITLLVTTATAVAEPSPAERQKQRLKEQKELGFKHYDSLSQPSKDIAITAPKSLIRELVQVDPALAYFVASLPATTGAGFTGSGGSFTQIPASVEDILHNAEHVRKGAISVAMTRATYEYSYSIDMQRGGSERAMDVAIRELDELDKPRAGSLRVYRLGLKGQKASAMAFENWALVARQPSPQ